MRQFGGWLVGAGLAALLAQACSDSGRVFGQGGAGGGGTSAGGTSAGVAGKDRTSGGGTSSDAGAGNFGGDGSSPVEGGAGGDGVTGTVCAADQPGCDGDRATTCNADGTGYSPDGTTCSSKQACVAGACEDLECSPGMSFCSGNSVRKCADTGLSSDEVKTCGSDEYCDVTSATCKTGVCAPDQPACDGKRATFCNSTGDGYAAGGTTCKSDETCDAGECKAHVCTPSASFCQGQDVKTCSDNGLSSSVSKTCTDQTCVELPGTADCQGICAPGQQDCSNNGVRTCDSTGQYGAATKCTNKTCVVTGTTAACKGKCAPTQTQCFGNGVASCGASGDWDSAMPCPDATPYCTAGACKAPPSCSPALSCNGESCCTSLLVSGGDFSRNNDSSYPATVSDFRLDKYEATVSRFRKFVAAVVAGWTPPAKSGKHTHLNGGSGLKNSLAAGYEPGWDTAWNVNLPSTQSDWETALACDGHAVWTVSAGSNETRPIACLNSYQAEAFCIWDGGFLPSETEWNYASAGGDQQRYYPWSSPASSTSIDCTYTNYYGTANQTDYCVSPGSGASLAVGSRPKGNGRYGQMDLGGNVAEWTLDWWDNLTATCVDCADQVPAAGRIFQGGSFATPAEWVSIAARHGWGDNVAEGDWGVRCARAP